MKRAQMLAWVPALALAATALVGPFVVGTAQPPTSFPSAAQLLPPGAVVEEAATVDGGFIRALSIRAVDDRLLVRSGLGEREIRGLRAKLPPVRRTMILGTDHQGRDLLARLVHAARNAATVAALATLLALALGTAFGCASALAPAWQGAALRLVTDATLGFPRLLPLLVCAVILRGTVHGVAIAVALVGWMDVARLVEADARATLGLPFVEAASAAGSGAWRVAFRHVIPNTLPILATLAPLVAAEAVLLEATLAYLGAGASSDASWGAMVAEGQRLLPTAWWMCVFPGMLVVATAFAVYAPATAAGPRRTLPPSR